MTSLVRLPAVISLTGLARATIYLRVKQGLLPTPVKLGERAVAWPADEVLAINAARIAGKSDEEIRALVAALTEQRTATAQA